MQKYSVEDKVVELGQYIVDNNATIRETAKAFNVSKTAVYNNIMNKLETRNPELYRQVLEVLSKNKAESHLKAGKATQKKYAELKRGKQNDN